MIYELLIVAVYIFFNSLPVHLPYLSIMNELYSDFFFNYLVLVFNLQIVSFDAQLGRN